jgi:plasmid stabilization system protein ParE
MPDGANPPFMSVAASCVRGPAMLQSCGTSTDCHALSLNADASAPMQVPRYRALIFEARKRLQQMPTLGHHREVHAPGSPPVPHQPAGRSASHFFLFRVADTERRIEVVRVLHEAMDIPRHWSPPR